MWQTFWDFIVKLTLVSEWAGWRLAISSSLSSSYYFLLSSSPLLIILIFITIVILPEQWKGGFSLPQASLLMSQRFWKNYEKVTLPRILLLPCVGGKITVLPVIKREMAPLPLEMLSPPKHHLSLQSYRRKLLAEKVGTVLHCWWESN